MTQIVIIISLFCFKQKIQVFQDNYCIEIIEVPTYEINSLIEQLHDKYAVEKITFINQNYLSNKCEEYLKEYLKSKEIYTEISNS